MLTRDLKLDEDGDLDVSSGTPHLTTGAEAAQQEVRIRLGFFLGEWFLDEAVGIPYRQQILIKNPSFPAVRELFRLAILDAPDIASVRSVNIVYARDRTARIHYRAVLLDGSEVSQ